MDLETAVDGVERFLARWRNGHGHTTDRGRMHDLGSVIIQAGLDPDAPELTTTHLETLLNAISTQLRSHGIGEKYNLGHGGAYCAHCRTPMREGTPVVRATAPRCLDCAEVTG
jgi:hypothetical protein